MDAELRENPIDDPVQQQLWEFVYDLLPDDEADALIARIGSEPHVARAYAEVQLQAGLVRAALRSEAPPVPLQAPDASRVGPRSKARWAAAPPRRSRLANWLAPAVAASLLLMVTYSLWEMNRLAERDPTRGAPPVRTTVLAPATQMPGVPSPLTVVTRSMAGERVSAPLKAEVRDEQRQVLWEFTGATDSAGQLQLNVPVEHVALQNSLHIQTRGNTADEAVIANFTVQEAPSSTFLVTDRPVYEPGETMYFRSVTAPKLATDELPEVAIEYEVRDPSGQVVPQSQQRITTQQGVGSGAIELDESAAVGLYALVGRSPEARFREVRREFVIQHEEEKPLSMQLVFDRARYKLGEEVVADLGVAKKDGTPVAGAELTINAQMDDEFLAVAEPQLRTNSDGTAQIRLALPQESRTGEAAIEVNVRSENLQQSLFRTLPLEAPIAEVQLLPEGGYLVPDVPNRLYFAARNALGEPIAFSGRLKDASGTVVAELMAEHEGRGQTEFVPRPGEYQLELAAPEGWMLRAEPLTCTPEHFATLNTGRGVFAAREPLELSIAANRPQRFLLVRAACGGVDVGQVAVTTSGGEQLQPITLPVSDAAQGVLRVTVFDTDRSPPRALAERLVYRRPAGQLRLQQTGDPLALADQTAQWSVEATDEQGQQVQPTWGIAVVGGKAQRRWGSELPAMETYFGLMDSLEDAAELEYADLYVAENPIAERTLDLLLGAQGWRRIERTTETYFARTRDAPADAETEAAGAATDAAAIVQPPKVFDNLAQIQQRQMRAELLEEQRLRLQRATAQWLVPVALVALSIVVALAVFRLARTWVWIPSLGVAAAALMLGLMWFGEFPGMARRGGEATIARSDEETARSARAPASPATAAFEATPDSDADGRGLEKSFGRPEAARAEGAPEAGSTPEMPTKRAVPESERPDAADVPPPPAPAPEQSEALRPRAVEPPAPPAPVPGDRREAAVEAIPPLSDALEASPAEPSPAGESPAMESLAMQGDAAPNTARRMRQFSAPLVKRAEGRASEHAGKALGSEALRKSNDALPGVTLANEPAPDAKQIPPQDEEQAQDFALGRGGALGGAEKAVRMAPGLRDLEGDKNDSAAGIAGGGSEGASLASTYDIRRYQNSSRGRMDSLSREAPVTLFWDPLLAAENGRAMFEFHVPDGLESLQLMAFAHAGTRFGTLYQTIPISPPVTIAAPPLAGLRTGDVFRAPLIIANNTRSAFEINLDLSPSDSLAATETAAGPQRLALAPQSMITYWLPEQRVVGEGDARLAVRANWGQDQTTFELRGDVEPQAPVVLWDLEGVLMANDAEEIELPAEPGSAVDLTLRGFPSQAAELRSGLLRLAERVPQSDPRLGETASAVGEWFQQNRIADPELLAEVRKQEEPDVPEQQAAVAGLNRFNFTPPATQESSQSRKLARSQREGNVESYFSKLKELAANQDRPAVTPAPVKVEVRRGRTLLAQPQVPANSSRTLQWGDSLDVAEENARQLELAVDGARQMPYELEARIYLKQRSSSPATVAPRDEQPLTIEASLSDSTASAGDLTTLAVRVTRAERRPVRVVVMMPGGTALDAAQGAIQLEAAGVEQVRSDSHSLVFDWPAAEMPSENATHTPELLELSLPLVTQLPGRFVAPPATAYYADAPQQPSFASELVLEIQAQ